MTKNLIAGTLLSAALLAQTATPTQAIAMDTNSKENVKTAVMERQENRGERRDEALEKIASRVEARFDRHNERLDRWIGRAGMHIEKKEAAGKDMTSAKTALETAKTSLAQAQTLGDTAVTKLRAITPENWSEQKADAQAARAAVKEAQVAYAQVIKDMKLALVELKKTN